MKACLGDIAKVTNKQCILLKCKKQIPDEHTYDIDIVNGLTPSLAFTTLQV
jgi:hypothetical protein